MDIFLSDANAVHFPNSGNYVVWGLNIQDNTDDDIQIDDADIVTMINSQFNNSKVNYTTQANQWIVYKNYTVDVIVQNKYGIPIENATVNLTDKDGNMAWTNPIILSN